MAGLPGTGLGGIFYVLLVIWMVVRESWLMARGSSTRGRWPRIACLGSLAAAIVGALWIEGLILHATIVTLPAALPASTHPAVYALNALTPAVAALPFAILAILLISLHLAQLLLHPPRQKKAPAGE